MARLRWAGFLLGKILLVTLLVGVVGELIAGYYADVREAANLKQDLGEQVMALSAAEAEGLAVLSGSRAPHSQLVLRCESDPREIPATAGPVDEVCQRAVIDEILDEQERLLAVRETHLEGQVLHQRLETVLEDGTAADTYGDLLRGLEILRALETSDSCGPERVALFDELQGLYPDVSSRGPDLVGPDSPDGRRCDQHGPAYPAAAAYVTRLLAFEGEVVNAEMASSHVTGLTDTRPQLRESLLGDPLLWGLLVVGAALMLLTWTPKSEE